MKIEGKEYRTIWFENNVVKIIDQTKLPHQFIIKDLKTVKDAINAIKKINGSLVSILDADDFYNNQKIYKQVEVFKMNKKDKSA